MREYLLQLKTQSIELWQKMTKIQKIIIIGSAVLLFGVLILLARGATKPDYGVLFTLRDEQSANQAKEKIKEMKIPYKVELTSEGTTILIPTKDIPETRLSLAGENITTGGVVGFESFDNTKFGETDTDRRARYLRALQGELTRTIESMAEVDTARVHIVLPEPSLFMDEQKNATAAVMLKLKPNKTLKEGQVKGVVKLVSNSVEGLKADNVTIVDMSGNVLSEDIGSDEETKKQKLTVTQVELEKQFQKEIEDSVQSMLERIVGIGKAVVRVQLQLDFDRIQEKSQKFGDKVTRSEQLLEENNKSSSTTDSGAPGTDSNIPGYESPALNGNNESAKTEKIRNYEIDSVEEIKEVAPGSVKRLSVAVVIDKEIDAKQQKVIEDVVKSAAGFDDNRGDQISVAGMPFNTAYQDEMKSQIAKAEKQQQMLIYVGLGALALLVIAGVVASIVIKKRREKEEPYGLEEKYAINPVPIMQVEDIMASQQELSPADQERKKIKDQVEKVAKEHPDDIAQLLRTWLAEE